MPVQVSLKKQFILMIMLAIIFLGVVEAGANIWLFYFYTCAFEKSEVFKDVSQETKKKICLENLGYGFTEQRLSWERGTRLIHGLDEKVVYINSEGFRGPEFTKDKMLNTYRIFVVGGSTTFGSGVFDNQTFPYYLQTMFDEANLNFKVEVINAGWPFGWSLTETDLIKSTLLEYEPDQFIVFDGWNDLVQVKKAHQKASATKWKERWMEICELGNQQSFDTIITLQPAVNTGKQILTNQELRHKIRTEESKQLENYPLYVEQLDDLKNHCTLTADLRSIFNHVQEPIFYDQIHVGTRGNEIIAENLYALSLPIIKESATGSDSKIDYEAASSGELDSRSISDDIYTVFQEFYFTLGDIILPYKTPRILPLIFEQ